MPKLIDSLESRASSLRGGKRYDDAAQVIQVVIQLQPDRNELHYTLSSLLSAGSREKAALEHASIASEQANDNSVYLSWLSRMYIDNGRFDDAGQVFDRVESQTGGGNRIDLSEVRRHRNVQGLCLVQDRANQRLIDARVDLEM